MLSFSETARLTALQDLEILDTAPEQIYDDVVYLAAAICQTPDALINFIDAERQWSKAQVQEGRVETPRELSFCAHTIQEPDGIYVVPDASVDPRWADHPDVTGAAGVRFYAGAAIIDDAGHALGSVCVVDTQARHLTPEHQEALRRLARQTAAHLRLRAQTVEVMKLNEQLRHAAIHDALTGLPARAFFDEVLTIALRQRGTTHPGVLFCDLNHFKTINDRLGHEAGDHMLKLVARRLRHAAREGDLVARLGGDEFVVLCPRITTTQELITIADRLRATVSQEAHIATETIHPQISIGLAIATPGESAASVLRRADAAMYIDKRRGGDQTAAQPSR